MSDESEPALNLDLANLFPAGFASLYSATFVTATWGNQSPAITASPPARILLGRRKSAAATFFVGEEIFFGKDRLSDVEEAIVART